MGKKRSSPLKAKTKILQACKSEEYSLVEICSFYNTHHKTVKTWPKSQSLSVENDTEIDGRF